MSQRPLLCLLSARDAGLWGSEETSRCFRTLVASVVSRSMPIVSTGRLFVNELYHNFHADMLVEI